MTEKELLKALELCSTLGSDCNECEYSKDPDLEFTCSLKMHQDAYEYIKKLLNKIEKLKKQRDRAFDLLVQTCKDVRERTGEDYVCGLCEYDGAYIAESGNWGNECPGFETDECFCISAAIKKQCGVDQN